MGVGMIELDLKEHRFHAEARASIAQSLVQRAKGCAVHGANGQMESVVRAKPQGLLIRETSGGPKFEA